MPFPPSISCPFILASGSPRRRTLLNQIDMDFEVEVSPADETIDQNMAPSNVARTLARRKAKPVVSEHPNALILTADTVVSHEETVLGKPKTAAHARQMLCRLSDTTHAVHTGFCLSHARSHRQHSAVETTNVTFGALSDREIQSYVESGSPMDKAGGYGIQDHTGPLLVSKIAGDYYSVVGLPLHRFYRVLRRDFSDLLVDSA